MLRILLIIALLPAWALAADEPQIAPAEKPTPLSLANGLLQFTPPELPWELTSIADGGHGVFYRKPGGTMLISAYGSGSPRNPRAEQQMKDQILTQLKASMRQKQGIKMTKDPHLVADDRFWVVVHEVFEKEGHTQGQWHIYRNLPPHQIVVTVIALMDLPEEGERAKVEAEKVALSAGLVPKGQKPPPAPDTPRKTTMNPIEPTTKPVAGDPAAKELDEAIARVEAELSQRPDYARARKEAAEAAAKLEAERKADPQDKQALADAWQAALAARKKAEAMLKEACDKDEAVIEARRKLAQKK